MASPTTTLADLAARVPAASRIFRRHGLDYCCGGRRPVADACRERGLDPDAVMAEVEQATVRPGDPVSFVDRPVNELIEHILTRYHDPLRAELPELVAMAKKVERVHADKAGCPHGLGEHLEMMHADVLTHLAKEEQILFPMISAGAGARTQGPIAVMTHEHDDHGKNLRRVRELTGDFVPPDAACTTWRALYLRLEELEGELMDHIHLENNVLFPKALRAAS
jgi:regulator of cell morphogenesis and NO signaling